MSAVNKVNRSKAPILESGFSWPVLLGVSVKHLILEESTAIDRLSSTFISDFGSISMTKYLLWVLNITLLLEKWCHHFAKRTGTPIALYIIVLR
jgi:hypothetical protein